MNVRPPLPPFTLATATLKVRIAEDAWNSRDAGRLVAACTQDCRWRLRCGSLTGPSEITDYLAKHWANRHDARRISELWTCHDNRIALRALAEHRDDAGEWTRTHYVEIWEFTDDGRLRWREVSQNERPLKAADRLFHWPYGPRPKDHPGLTELGL